MPAKKQKPQPNHTAGTVTLDANYAALPYTTNIGSSMGTDTITVNNTLWSGGAITSPYTYTTNSTGAGTGNWNNTTLTNGSIGSTVHIDADGLTMKEGADIKIGGKSLTEAIEKIEQRLGILNPNPALEERWDKLKDLREQYIEMERDILEKEKIMKILKAV